MKITHIIYGPQGCGKTTHKNMLAEVLNPDHIFDGATFFRNTKGFMDDQGRKHTSIPENSMVLTNMSASECEQLRPLCQGEAVITPFSIIVFVHKAVKEGE